MRIVLYFEWKRKSRKMLQYILAPVIFSMVLLLICMVTERFFPYFNENYMKWPDIVREFLCINGWEENLWFNVWQLFALIYPFYLIYVIMRDAARAVAEEDYSETIVYLYNAGTGRKGLFLAKWLIWLGEIFVCCASMAAVSVLFAAVLHLEHWSTDIVQYYGILFLVCVLYLSIALFMTACKGKNGAGADEVLAVLILPCLISRIPALLCFFSDLMEMTGREGAVADRLSEVGGKLEIMSIISPLTWCWPALTVSVNYVLCATVLFVVLSIAAFLVHARR